MDDLCDAGLRVVADCERERAEIAASRLRGHAVRDLLLHHDGDRLDRRAALEELHDDRCCDVVREVRDDLDRAAVISRIDDFLDVGL